jgi:hypothetical protein
VDVDSAPGPCCLRRPDPLDADAVLVVDHNGKVIEGDGQPPNALPIIS